MATRRFCDICDNALTPEDDKPFIRAKIYTTHPDTKAVAHVMIMNENNHILTDCCNECKLKVVNEGTPEEQNIATLQPAPMFVAPSLKADLPIPPPLPIEPSIPRN